MCYKSYWIWLSDHRIPLTVCQQSEVNEKFSGEVDNFNILKQSYINVIIIVAFKKVMTFYHPISTILPLPPL